MHFWALRGFTGNLPLTDLLKLKVFTWNQNANTTFTQFKNIITTPPLLHLPDFTIPFVVETNASNSAIRAVLSQAGHPIAFSSKKLCPKKQNISVYVKEMLAITESVKKWRHYLIENHFQIITDHQSLRRLLTSACHTPEQQKWASRLIGYNFDILYRPGRHNQAVDFLSKPPSSVFLAISSPVPEIITKLKNNYQTTTGQLEKNKLIGIPNSDFNFHNDLLYHGQRLYIPSTTNLRPFILH